MLFGVSPWIAPHRVMHLVESKAAREQKSHFRSFFFYYNTFNLQWWCEYILVFVCGIVAIIVTLWLPQRRKIFFLSVFNPYLLTMWGFVVKSVQLLGMVFVCKKTCAYIANTISIYNVYMYILNVLQWCELYKFWWWKTEIAMILVHNTFIYPYLLNQTTASFANTKNVLKVMLHCL